MKKLFFFITTILIASLVYAHVPYVITRDKLKVRIGEIIEKSLAYYLTLEDEEDVDMLYFRLKDRDFDPELHLEGLVLDPVTGEHVKKNVQLLTTDENGVTGRKLHLGSLVPACGVYSDVKPTVALVGPRQEYLKKPDGSIDLPFEIDDDEGVFILENKTQGEIWYESYTYKSYFDQKKADVILTKEGKYKIYIWEPNGNTGDYVLETGYIEVFNLPEIARSIFWITHLVNDGEISCDECKEQLEDLDGKNPSMDKVIEDLSGSFK